MSALCSSTQAEEVREYEVLVKQKPVGKVSIRIGKNQDGTTVAVTDTTVNAEFFFIKYHYEYHGKETWQGDRLVQLQSRADDDGKALAVSAITDSHDSRIATKVKPSRIGPALVMTSNYWRLPDPQASAGKFSIIDSDTGTVFAVRLQRIGPDSVVVEGQRTPCQHFQVSGDTASEIWFDDRGRLVRQQTVEQGYTTELRLVRIRETAAAE